jgi:hypothetical protein
MIDLDEMKTKWAALDQNVRLNQHLLTAMQLQPRRSRFLVLTALHGLGWLACMVALGGFLYDHISAPRFVIAAGVLDVYSIALLISLIRQMAMVSQIGYGLPVTAIQRQVETIRVMRIRTTQWAVLAGVALWAPALIVAFEAFLGLDAYKLFGGPWVAANVLFGLALIPLTLWVSKRFGPRLSGHSLVKQVMDGVAGRNLTEAAKFLADLSAFEKEA